MNIMDAIKSNKRFRRKGTTTWFTPGNVFYGSLIVTLTYNDIVADDWEIQEEVIKITESLLRDAIIDHMAVLNSEADIHYLFNKLKESAKGINNV